MKTTTQITKITCDSCEKFNEGTYLPDGWLELKHGGWPETDYHHICSDCRIMLFNFLAMLGIKYSWEDGTVYIKYPNEED